MKSKKIIFGVCSLLALSLFATGCGKEIEIKFYAPHPTLKKKAIEGVLKGYDEENITITCGEEDIVIERKLVAFVSPVLKF